MRYQGFTLLELLVVVGVLGILAVVTFTVINPAERLAQGRDARRRQDVAQIATALESYFTTRGGVYPTAGGGLSVLTGGAFLKHLPVGNYAYVVAPAGCDNVDVSCSRAAVNSSLEAEASSDWWVYRSACGGAAGDTAPATASTIGDCP